jgi:hypothetical protein
VNVNESLRNYATGKTGVETLERWPVSLEKIYPQVLDTIVVPMMETHDIHAITWVGKNRVRKSTVSKTIAFNISAYQIVKNKRDDLKPSMVAGKKIDFFRHEPGSVYKPAIGDDVAISSTRRRGTQARRMRFAGHGIQLRHSKRTSPANFA